MKLNALLISRDPASLGCLATVLAKLDIEAQFCTSCAQGMGLLLERRYSAIVLDFDVPGATRLSQMARLVRPDRPPLVVALLAELGPVSGAFQAGIKFVLHKPVKKKEAAQSLWDAKQFMRRDRRRLSRDSVRTLVHLQVAGATLPALLRDLSEQGLALQAPEPLSQAQSVPLRFVLPGTARTVRAIAEVIWADDAGRSGMFFSWLTPSSRRYLRDWFARRRNRSENSVRVLLPPRNTRRSRSSVSV